MKITDMVLVRLKLPKDPGRSRLFLRVDTDEGVSGISEAGRSRRMMQVFLDETVKPLIVGMDPCQPRVIREILALGDGQRATRLPSQVVGAIDVALWDITGKVAGLPLYAVLGGAFRTEIPLYWSRGNGWHKSPEEMLAEVQEGFERGFRAFKIRMDWRDYRQDSNPRKDFSLFEACREWLPEDVPLSFDANNGYSVPTAIEQGRRFEQLGIAHFEEPLPQYDLAGLKQVVDALDCAVSSGEQETSAWRIRDMILLGNPDIVQPDVLNVGGISEMLRSYEMCVAANKVVMPHSPNAGANLVASLHAYATVRNAVRPHEFSEEFTGPAEAVADLFAEPIIPEGGVIRLPDRPGLGLELNPDLTPEAD